MTAYSSVSTAHTTHPLLRFKTYQVRRVESAHETIGRPVTFLSGQFEGKTVRTEIVELQKADLGRKYARKDRRPLDPPPVVQLKLYQVFNHGTSRETEQEMDCYDDVRGFGILCHVDLFPVPDQDEIPPNSSENGRRPRQPRHKAKLNDPSSSTLPPPPSIIPAETSPTSAHPNITSAGHPQTTLYYQHYSHQNIDGGLSLPPIQIPELPSQPNGTSIYSSPESLVAYLGEYPITEGSKCTDALVGASFCQSATLEYQGKRVLMFVFSDLAVRIEGSFILRYRVFNVFAKAHGTQDIPILAECYGGSFKIYSTKEFPGLRASTDLTKHLSFFGVRLNLRENERKRRKKVVPSSSATNTTATTADNSNAPRSLPQTQAHARGVSRKRKSDDGDGGESQRSDDDEDGSLDGYED
ncbi:velvet factor-domain-containing protein [Abortiporus biennis]|nr:velvet factor-domain-containing protein [Abortiporus biennis]